MSVLWPERLARIKQELDTAPEHCPRRHALTAMGNEIEWAAIENIRSHAFYLSQGGRDRYFSEMEDMYRKLFPDEQNQ